MVGRPHKFRFWPDENFPAHAGEFLKSKGHHISNTKLITNVRTRDNSQLRSAIKHRAILITSDKDFNTAQIPPKLISDSYGIVIAHTNHPTPEQYRRRLTRLAKTLTPQQLKGKYSSSR